MSDFDYPVTGICWPRSDLRLGDLRQIVYFAEDHGADAGAVVEITDATIKITWTEGKR